MVSPKSTTARYRRLLPWHRLAVCCALLANVTVSAKAESGSAPDRQAMRTWIEQLDARSFATRRRASRLLADAGQHAIPLLVESCQRAEPEVIERIIFILEQNTLGTDLTKSRQAARALHQIAQADWASSSRAKRAIQRYRVKRRNWIIAYLESKGGKVEQNINRGNMTLDLRLLRSWSGGVRDLELVAELEGIKSLMLEGTWLTDEGLKYLRDNPDLSQLVIGPSRVTAAGLRHLATCPKLSTLILTQLRLPQESLIALQSFPALTDLNLLGSPISDDALVQLGALENIERLNLSRTRITDAGLVHLQKMTKLQTLAIQQTSTAGPGIAALNQCPNLKDLSLKGVHFPADSVQHLATLTRLHTLRLEDTNLLDEDMQHLTGLDKLRVLWLSKVQITDAAVKHLQQLGELKQLFLHGSQITEAGATKLRETVKFGVYR